MLLSLISFGAVFLAAACFVVDFGAFAFYIFNSVFFLCGSWASISKGATVPTTLDLNAHIALSFVAALTLNTIFGFVGFLIWAAGVQYFVKNFVYDDMLCMLNTVPYLKNVADLIEGLE